MQPALSSLLAFSYLETLWHCPSFMDIKTLLVLSCILAAAQARPAAVASSTSCSLRCSGRNFWTGYTAGTTLQYEFEQKVELKSGLSQDKSVLMQVKGRANFEVHSDCEMVLTVDIQNTKSSKAPAEATTMETKSLPKALVDALKAPLRFAFEDGRVGGMCPGSAETRASLNFKRGLLSQLHMSIDQPNQEAKVRENDVLGNCWTVYKQLSSNKVEKTKDLSSCTNNFELDGESMVIKENICEENRILDNSLGERRQGERVKVETSLRFKQKLDSLASALFEISDRSDLKHQHKTGDSCHDSKAWFEEDVFHSGNECLEKKLPTSGVASTDFKELAKQTFEELCQETRGNEMLNSTAAKYVDAIKYMRGITSQSDFDALFNWGKTGYCTDNSMFKVLLYSALPTVGTRISVKVMLNQLKESDAMSPEPATSNWLVKGIAMMPHPTPEIISDVLNYTRKVQAEAMMPTKDAPLALAAVTGRYCAINTDCESNEAVSSVLTFYSDALGTNCSKLASASDDPFNSGVENAFTALLSIGNIGRAKGGASVLIGCGENSNLSLVNRAFALRSLRRFPSLSNDELMRLGRLIGSKDLDSELRITAYQAMVRYTDAAFWSDERAITKLSELMRDDMEDINVQRYIYSHLSRWMKKQSRLTDSYTVSAILRDFERKVVRTSNVQGLLVSGNWVKKFKNPSMKSKIELESNLIYSSTSFMPRFVNLNFTVESPLSAEAINMFELGVRTEGMESTMQQLYNSLSGRDRMRVRKRRQADGPELTDEQKQYQMKALKQRFDFFTRQNGMELTHINFDEAILSAVPAIMKSVDLQNLQGLLQEKLSNFNFDQNTQLAGTQMESTISIPTISGFPILLKKEVHYLLNMVLKQEFRMPSMLEMNMGFEAQPSGSVYMARTVTVDAGFERAGLRSRTSGVTSLGVKLNLDADFSDLNDIKFSYKVDPLKKRQKILELKTDVQFLQHRGPSNVIENPVLSELTPVTVKCFTPASVKLFGRKMCLETNFERTYNPMEYVRQNPGSFRLYIDKNDTLGVYEATLRLKIEGRNANFTALLGDQVSPDRHAKFQFILTRSEGLRKIVLELANPVLPIKWESENRANGEKSDVSVALKFGQTDYEFRGTRSRDEDGSSKLEGDFYRKDKERQKLNIVTKFQSFGILPLFQFDFAVTTTDNNKLTFSHLSKYEPGNFQLTFLASHEKENSVLTSINSRLECTSVSGERNTRTFAYNTEVVNKNGKNFLHTFTIRVDRLPKAASDQFQSTVSVIHKFNYGVTKQRSALDVEANLSLEETIRPSQLYKAIGSGSIQYGPSSNRKTATLTKLRFVFGEDDVIDEHYNTKTFLVEYAADLDGSQSAAFVALQVLPWDNWRTDNQCIYLKFNASQMTGSESQRHAFELRHSSGYSRAGSSSSYALVQVAKMVYSNNVLLDLEHKLYSIPTSSPSKTVFGHHLNATAFNDQSFLIKNEYSVEMPDADMNQVIRVSTAVAVNQQKMLQINQSVSVRPETRRAEYKLDYKFNEYTSFSMTMYAQDYSMDDRRRSAMEIASYLRSARRDFKIERLLVLVKNFIYQIKVENGFKFDTPSTSIQVTNYVDMTVTKGVMLNISRIIRSDGVSFNKSLLLFKELDLSDRLYRRVYKVNVKNNDWEKLFTFETKFKRSSNPELSISFARVSLLGSQRKDYNITSVGRFIPQVERWGQVAVQLNITQLNQDEIYFKSSLGVTVDTDPMGVPNPALNVSFNIAMPGSGAFKTIYNLGLQKSGAGQSPGAIFLSNLTIQNTFEFIPFLSYKGINSFSSDRNQPFNLVVQKTLDGNDLINIQTRLNSQQLYIGVKSDRLPLREVSYNATYNEDTDGFITYVSKIRFWVLRWDIGLKDNGRFKVTGRNDDVLFATVYSGNMEFEGLEALIGTDFTIDRLDYNGKLEAKSTGEFDTNMELIKVQGTTTENLGLVSAKLSYWPFEISSQFKTPLWNVGQYGFNISAGPKEPENGFRFKAWVASPAKQSALKYWHTYTQGQTFEVNSEAELTSDHLLPASSDGIKSTLKVTGSSMFDYTYSMNVTTPFPSAQRMQTDSTYNNDRQTLVFSYKRNDVDYKIFDFQRNVRVSDTGARLINTSFSVNPFDQSQIMAINMDAVIGSDYLLGMEFRKGGLKYAAFDLVYITSGSTYPQLSRLGVPGANLGFDLSLSTNSRFYLLRTGDNTNGEWKMKFAMSESAKAETSVTLADGRVTAGSGEIFGKSVTFSSPAEGSIQVTVASEGGTNTITWTSSKDGNVLRNLQIRFSIGEKSSCVSYTRQGQQVDVQYGSCDTPNTIKLTYQVSDFWEISKAKVQVTIEHKTNSGANTKLYVLPGLSLPLTTLSEIPFNAFVDVNNEERKGNVSFTKVNRAFTAGVTYTEEAATEKKMIEFKGEWRPRPGSVPSFLRLWRQKIDGGYQYALQFQAQSGKDITVASDVTNYRYTSDEFGMDISTRLSSSLIEKLRSANSVIKFSYIQDPTNKNYTINYQETFTTDSVVYYELESVFKGQEKRFPSTLRVASVGGYILADFSYSFDPESYVRFSLDKFYSNRNSYLAEYRSKDASAHVGSYWRDFSLEISSPRRQLYLSESCKLLENGTVQTEIQAYLNKRNMEGFTAVLNKDFTVPNVYKRTLRLTLPTRTVGYDRVMKTEGISLGYNLTVFWDMQTGLEKKITIQFNREKEQRASGYYYYHKLGMAAPFLKNKITKELRYESSAKEFQFSVTHAQESSDSVTIAMNGQKYWDPVRSAMQREVNISFAQQKGDVKANARIIINSKKLSNSKVYSNSKYMTEVNIYATVPTKSIDSHVRIRSVPFEEFTFACNHGATISYRYFKGFERSRLSLFVSDSNKDAGQLTVTCDRVKSVWEATLDTGKGYMNPKSPLSFPFYKPTKVMIKASAGLSNNRKKIHFGALNGEMAMDSSMKLWKPETIPAEIDFFFVGAQLNNDNTLGYASHWRIRQQTKKSPFTVAKEVLVDPWAKTTNLPISIGTINSLMRPVKQSQADNINTDVVLDMLTSISSNDIDSLNRWALKARENNEFMSNTIGKAMVSAFYVCKGGVEAWLSMIQTSQYTNALPAIDSGIRSGISWLSDTASRALSRIPVARIWSSVLSMTKYFTDQIGAYFSSCVEMLDNYIRTRISSLTASSSSSVFSVMYNALASVFPVSDRYEKMSRVAQEYSTCIQTAAEELISQFAKVVQPILVNTLGALPKVYDFFDNLAYERSQWRGYVSDLIKACRNNGNSIEQKMSSQTAYSRNLAESAVLLLDGYYGRAIKQFFNTDANEVRVWRLSCDQKCMDGGSFAAINGTVYLPFPAIAFPEQSNQYERYLPPFYSYSPWWQKLKYNLNARAAGTMEKYFGRYSVSGMLLRVLQPSHRTATVGEDSISTFGGIMLRNLSPCRYLLAHDFLNGDFSIYATYTWNGSRRRLGDLLIRIGNRRIFITNTKKVRVDGSIDLPENGRIELDNPKLVIISSSYSQNLYLEIDTEIRGVLKVSSYESGDIKIDVHPLYHGRINGAFGNMDGNQFNDLHGGSASDHMRLWNAGMCVMAAPSK
uniref:Vitellogenin domain-containing protein n=1 Tax=Macrostomum lignano TaxID=282301 RepID=A0A1I8J1W3_9PLAT